MIYDLIILGGGPAGYLAAERAGHAGLSVLLFEERTVGGVCLNEGCIPTKTLLYSAKIFDNARNGEKYGVKAENLTIDHAAVIRRKDKVVKVVVSGVKSSLKSNGVTVLSERGRISGKVPDGYKVSGASETYIGRRLLIATGSSPAVPPIPGLNEGMEGGFVLTNREILDLKEKPDRLCVIGGGIIGLEMASYFCSVGSQVTVIEMLDHIAGENDRDLIKLLQADFEKRGIVFVLNAKVTSLDHGSMLYEKDGQSLTAQADKVLLSIGRRPNIRDIGLESIGVLTERGAIVTDSHMLTNQPDVYAAGDVNGMSMLAHTAYREAEVAVNRMLGQQDIMRYDAIPSVLYTNPELASVGETEASAKSKGLPYKTVSLSMRFSGRYVAENEGGNGMLKLVVNENTRQILGLQALCNYASEFIIAAGSYVELGLTLDEIKKIVFPHPTVCEIIREAVFQYE